MLKKCYFIIFICLLQIRISGQSNTNDSLKVLLNAAAHDTVRCNILLQLIANEYDDSVWPSYNSQLKQISEKNLKSKPSKSLELLFQKYLSEAINNEGYLASQRGNAEQALIKYYACLSIQEKINDQNGIATSLNNIAYVFQFQGDVVNALKFYSKSLKIYEDLKDKTGIGRALNNIGIIYDDQGNIPKALEYYHKSLRIREEINEKEGIAACLNNIGTIYHHQGSLDKALEYYYKSIKFQKEIDDNIGVAISLGNIGSIYISKMDGLSYQNLYQVDTLFTKALKLYNQSLVIQKESNNKKGVADTYSGMASAYKARSAINNNKKRGVVNDSLLVHALYYYNLSLKIREEIQDKTGIANSLNSIAKLEVDLNQVDLAKENAEKSLKLSRELGYPENIKNSSEILSVVYALKKDYKKAFEMQVLFKQMSDSIFNESSRKASISKSYQYAYEKKASQDSIKISEEKKVITVQLKQEKMQRFALYGGIFLVGLFGVFMYNRFKVTKKQNHLIELQKTELQKQKELVEEHQKETLDSIHYAKRIQTALIANSDFITQHIPNNFIYFNPKDIVSGDFYWATKHNNKFYLAVCDSTGHGVPGAFMSLLNMGFLSEAIKEKGIEKPNEVFNYVRERLISTISDDGQKDGMDGILICIDTNLSVRAESRTITYVAANSEPILIRDNEIIELSKDKMPVGKGEKTDKFSLHTVELKQGDTLYLYTDGFADQFGGPKGKKFKYKQLNELLLSNSNQSLQLQKETFETSFQNWKGSLEQVDDVLIIGIQF